MGLSQKEIQSVEKPKHNNKTNNMFKQKRISKWIRC